MNVFYTIRSYVREWWAKLMLFLEPPPDDPDYEGDEHNDPDEHEVETDNG